MTAAILVTVCFFKRKERSDMESGIMINQDSLIIDQNGKPVKAPIWSFVYRPDLGNVLFHLPIFQRPN